MLIARESYIKKLVSKRWNGRVKIITGIRRCGKSFLLSVLYKNFLLGEGVQEDNIISIDLERGGDAKYRNPLTLQKYIVRKTSDRQKRYYLFIDEIQLSTKVKNPDFEGTAVPDEDRELTYISFYDVLGELNSRENIDIYVTGSNSRMLSKDIVTNFRDRASEIKVYPLSFAEYYSISGKEKAEAIDEYMRYGGMPSAVLEDDKTEKESYLKKLHENVYYKDIIERYNLGDDLILDALVDSLYSAVGSLSNVHNLASSASAAIKRNISDNTVKSYIGHLEDAYLIQCAQRYDIKGKRYFDYPKKYYAIDLGLRNAKLNFRQQDYGHLMENMIFNELIRRGYSVDVGMVKIYNPSEGYKTYSQHEVDFIVNTGSSRTYIQSAWDISTESKRVQESLSLNNIGDSFRKIVIVGGGQQMWTDENGISYMGVIPFLLGEAL